MDAVEHVIYRLRNATVGEYPYPHFFIRDVFPPEFYSEIIGSLPSDDAYAPLKGGYKSRIAATAYPRILAGFDTTHFASNVLSMFGKQFSERYPFHDRPKFRAELRLIRDSEGYSIGPHTDAPYKVVSLLFYLPVDFLDMDCGTGIYVPKDGVMTCPGGPHHKFDGFTEIWRAPFVPNSCFGFFKTNNSWHAVQKISRKIRRDVLLFNIYEQSTP